MFVTLFSLETFGRTSSTNLNSLRFRLIISKLIGQFENCAVLAPDIHKLCQKFQDGLWCSNRHRKGNSEW